MPRKNNLTAVIRHKLTNVTVTATCEDGHVVVEAIEISLNEKPDPKTVQTHYSAALNEIVRKIRGFLSGRLIPLDSIPLDLSWCTEFQKKVLSAARKIPRGQVRTYAELAKMAGYPAAVRAAASVMRQNRFPLVIPCHRVIGKNRTIGGFMGVKTGKPIILKKKLLDLEGANSGFRSLSQAQNRG
jgi:methylated-DNA-[protein]-cysteine S-methyltransferase